MAEGIRKENLRNVLVTDCGSTTTKALLFSKTEKGWRATARGESPTTVEEPVADVTVGALNAFNEIQETTKRNILSNDEENPFVFSGDDPSNGIDLYLSTSSAGGGLQMLVTGVVKEMSTESAERAALGAGAIVLDALSADDPREDHERIKEIRHLRPDIVLMTGGVEGGSTSHVIEAAELLRAAKPRPRFGTTLRLPIIYAGNSSAVPEIKKLLDDIYQLTVIDNVRPNLESENLEPAREAIHELFLTHVMSHSPGYGKLMGWTPAPILPTPAAVGNMVEAYANEEGKNVLCVDIGGATTDVFSVFENREGKRIFNRTVSANLGMSYSIANVLLEAGAENIGRWLPYKLGLFDLKDRLRNKMLRPTSIPQLKDDLYLEQAVCREALRLSLEHHRSLAVGLSGVARQRSIADIFSQEANRYELLNLMNLDIAIGSGGVLSHAPDRKQAALMLIEGFALEGITELAVDSVFMMPHLGVLATVHPEASAEIFNADCVVALGYSVVPVFPRRSKVKDLAEIYFDGIEIAKIKNGEFSLINLPSPNGELKVSPLNNEVNVGKGAGIENILIISNGETDLYLDGRNRPIEFSNNEEERVKKIAKQYKELLFL